MKPSWDEAPEWAQWLAQDMDSTWVWFEAKPEAQEKWEKWVNVGEQRWKNADKTKYNWTKTLEDRPK